jgi:broad specificity phosphatase PhoE
MGNLHSILDNFQLIPPEASYAVLLRHAERFNLLAGRLGNNVSLTKKGIEDARNFGLLLQPYNVDRIFSSPVLRCVQTANEITGRAGTDSLKIVTRTSLGEPGCYIKNPYVAIKYFLVSDAETVVQAFIARGKLDGFVPLKEGSTNLLAEILGDISKKGSRCLYISHDAVIAPFISYFTGEKFDHEHWLGYLDGVIITLLDGEVRMIRDGKENIIAKDQYP